MFGNLVKKEDRPEIPEAVLAWRSRICWLRGSFSVVNERQKYARYYAGNKNVAHH